MHNEATSFRGGNCLNSITKILEVSSRIVKKTAYPDLNELKKMEDYDSEHGISNEYQEAAEPTDFYDQLNLDSNSYLGAVVEENVIKAMLQKGAKMCSKCLDVFSENEPLVNEFINFKAEKTVYRAKAHSILCNMQTQ